MYIAICDRMLELAFDTPLTGLRHLRVNAVELELTHDFCVKSLEGGADVSLQSDADAKAYKQHLAALKVRPACLLSACDLSIGTPNENIAWTVRALELAELLGADSLRVDSFMANGPSLAFDERVRRFVYVMRSVISATPGIDLPIGIENHGVEGNDVTFLLSVLEAVDSSQFGMTVDTGNFYWRGNPLSEVYSILELLAPCAKHTHIKNIRYPKEQREIQRDAGWGYKEYVCPLDEGDIDHLRVVKTLAKAGYEGALCIENEAMWGCSKQVDRVEMLARDVAHANKLLTSVVVTDPG